VSAPRFRPRNRVAPPAMPIRYTPDVAQSRRGRRASRPSRSGALGSASSVPRIGVVAAVTPAAAAPGLPFAPPFSCPVVLRLESASPGVGVRGARCSARSAHAVSSVFGSLVQNGPALVVKEASRRPARCHSGSDPVVSPVLFKYSQLLRAGTPVQPSDDPSTKQALKYPQSARFCGVLPRRGGPRGRI